MGLTEGQRRCVDTLDRALVVAAGAGSGKTFTLTERIVNAFREGYIQDIGQVMAITFTRKAAGELKSRIKAALRANGLVEQALKVDGAWISTIHGMCTRILRAHALELGLDPAFTVVEGPDRSRMMKEALNGALAAARLERPQQTEALFREYAVSSQRAQATSIARMLERMVEAAVANPAGAEAFTVPESRVQPLLILEHIAATIEEVRDAALRVKESATRNKWLDEIEPAADAIQTALAAGEDDALAVLRLLAPVKFSKQFGSADYKAVAEDARMALTGCVVELRLALAAGHARTLAAIACDAYERFQQAKRSAGALDNGDLLVLAARALDGHPRIAERYADAFKLIMVDEFQDTDQLQIDMVKRLAGPDAQRLCTVGDAQQSIYRFRGADVSVYRRHLAAVRQRSPEDIIELHENFRSHADVLAFVERVFATPDMFGPTFMRLDPARAEDGEKRPFEELGPRISLLHTCAPHQGGVPGAALQASARRLAARLAALNAAGCPASDMVVLLGVMGNAGVYAQALSDVGLPCAIAGGTVFPKSLEALTVLDAVRVLADPHDTRALYRLLAGPVFCLSPDDLVQLATRVDEDGGLHRRPLDDGLSALIVAEAGGDEASRAAAGVGTRLSCVAHVMARCLRSVGMVPASKLVRRMVVESGWLTRLQEQGVEGLAGAGNILKALRFLEQEERVGGMGPAQLARRFAALLGGMKEGPGALSAADGDFVRIMTVHASKGLEFPVVALADLGSRPATGRFLLEDVGGGIFVSLDLDRTGKDIGGSANPSSKDADAALAAALYEGMDEDALAGLLAHRPDAFTQRAALALREQMGEDEERKRLLYVALTRAREALVIALTGKYSKSNPHGIPDGTLAATARALGYGEGDALVGAATYDFGGTHPAVVECLRLEPAQTAEEALGADEAAAGFPAPGADGRNAPVTALSHDAGSGEDGRNTPVTALSHGAGASADGRNTPVTALSHGAGGGADVGEAAFVPAPEAPEQIVREPIRLAHQGIFSYTSIADASHEGDLLVRLASAYAVGAGSDASVAETAAPAFDALSAQDALPSSDELPETVASWDGIYWDDPDWAIPLPAGSGAVDPDRATDLGTAFHRLAQYAVDARGADGILRMPPEVRIEALSRTCDLGTQARARLRSALERWFASDLAASMGKQAHLQAEVPFFVRLPEAAQQSGPLFLEGEIDLLALSDDGAYAQVVDYKTGGGPDETASQLAEKHALQASCYAYALLRDGVQHVDTAFVRVEQPDTAQSGQPQVVRYRFEAADLAAIEAAIALAAQRAL